MYYSYIYIYIYFIVHLLASEKSHVPTVPVKNVTNSEENGKYVGTKTEHNKAGVYFLGSTFENVKGLT